jgi:NAD(P)-dependent dehydrogenase (short-subunit alcohol dehydrogenase family)
MSKELSGKVAIITGGANGIGRGTAELFVEEGAKVVIADIDEERGRSLSASLGLATRFKHTDVAKREQVQTLVDFAVAEFGNLHIMFNNAGVSDDSYGSLLDDDFMHFERVMRVNVLGVMLGTQIAARYMAKQGGGSIINTASIAGVSAGHGLSSYRAAKAGVIQFTKSAAIELGPLLVRVNCICPGNIPTDMGTFASPAPGMAQSDGDRIQRAVRAVRMRHQPLQRQGQARDIGQAAAFLGGDRSLQITGQILSVDGGATAGNVRSQIAEIMEARASALAE